MRVRDAGKKSWDEFVLTGANYIEKWGKIKTPK